ncbi:MAG: hypothetical protein ABIJ21_05620 [Nanoarchaeota archaeon]
MKQLIGIVLLCLLPQVFALELSEIMYNPIGTDTGREWVEFVAQEEINVSQLRFFDNDGNHMVQIIVGEDILFPGDVLVVANDDLLFLAEYPGFAGLLAKSSFSLSNTGEEVGFRLVGQDPLDSYVYTSEFANGNGMTLEKQEGEWRESTIVGGTPGYQEDHEVPEFGSIAAGIALAGGILAFYALRRR